MTFHLHYNHCALARSGCFAEAISGLEWLDEEQSQPGQVEVQDEIERLTLLKAELQYRRDRLGEYLPISEQLDLLYWDDVDGTTNWSDHVASVKAKYPKPE